MSTVNTTVVSARSLLRWCHATGCCDAVVAGDAVAGSGAGVEPALHGAPGSVRSVVEQLRPVNGGRVTGLRDGHCFARLGLRVGELVAIESTTSIGGGVSWWCAARAGGVTRCRPRSMSAIARGVLVGPGSGREVPGAVLAGPCPVGAVGPDGGAGGGSAGVRPGRAPGSVHSPASPCRGRRSVGEGRGAGRDRPAAPPP